LVVHRGIVGREPRPTLQADPTEKLSAVAAVATSVIKRDVLSGPVPLII